MATPKTFFRRLSGKIKINPPESKDTATMVHIKKRQGNWVKDNKGMACQSGKEILIIKNIEIIKRREKKKTWRAQPLTALNIFGLKMITAIANKIWTIPTMKDKP